MSMGDPWDEPIPAELAIEQAPYTDDELDAALETAAIVDEPDDSPAGPRRWRPEDDNAAEWAGRKLAEAQKQRAAIAERAAEWNRRIGEWMSRGLKPLDRRASYFTALLQEYAVRRRETTGQATLDLPTVTVRTSDRKPRVIVEKADEFVGWAERTSHEALLRRPPAEPAMDAIKTAVKIEQVPVGYEIRMTLACGHAKRFVVGAGSGAPDLAETTSVECDECDHDPIDGTPDRAVETAVAIPITEATPTLDGQPVPGLGVDGGGVAANKPTVK